MVAVFADCFYSRLPKLFGRFRLVNDSGFFWEPGNFLVRFNKYFLSVDFEPHFFGYFKDMQELRNILRF